MKNNKYIIKKRQKTFQKILNNLKKNGMTPFFLIQTKFIPNKVYFIYSIFKYFKIEKIEYYFNN